MTVDETGPPPVAELPPLQDDRLYDAEETGRYVKQAPQWLRRERRAGRIPGGKLGRTPVWSAQNIRDLIAMTTSEPEPQKRESRGGADTKPSSAPKKPRRTSSAASK